MIRKLIESKKLTKAQWNAVSNSVISSYNNSYEMMFQDAWKGYKPYIEKYNLPTFYDSKIFGILFDIAKRTCMPNKITDELADELNSYLNNE